MKRFIILLTCVTSLFLSCKKDGSTNNNQLSTSNIQTPASLTITDFNPKTGPVGTKVTITGTGFGTNIYGIYVYIGDRAFIPLSISPTSMVIQIDGLTPVGKINANFPPDSRVYSADNFTPTLQVDNYDVNEVQLGHQLYITGQFFGTDQSKISVTFTGAQPVKANYLSLGYKTGAFVPRDAQPGKVTVTVDGRSATGAQAITLLTSMRDFYPKAITNGDTVIITGVGFTTKTDMYASFDNAYGTIVRPILVTPTQMSVIVPSQAQTGQLRIGSTSQSLNDYSDDKFTFTPTVYFTDMTPKTAKVNDVVQFTGDFAGNDLSKISVSFGGSKGVQPSSLSGFVLSVKVPIDAKTGKITISIVGYKPSTSSFIFTVSP